MIDHQRERLVTSSRSITKCRISLGSKEIIPGGPFSEEAEWIKKCVEFCEGIEGIQPWPESAWVIEDACNLLCSFANLYATDGFLGDKKAARVLGCAQFIRGEITPDPKGNGTTDNARYAYKCVHVALRNVDIESERLRPTIDATRSVWWAAHESGAEPLPEIQKGCKEDLSKQLVAEALVFNKKAEINPPLVLALVRDLMTLMNLY